MTLRVLAVAAMLLAVVTTATTAGPEKVAFPAEYKKSHVLYGTVDRPDNKTVRDLYASPEAARAAAPGQPVPDGTVLTMEVYKAKVDDKGEPVKDASGRLARTADLVGIFVMEKRRGWGSEYPEALRNGEWEYARFTASGQPQPKLDTKVLPVPQAHGSSGLRVLPPEVGEATQLRPRLGVIALLAVPLILVAGSAAASACPAEMVLAGAGEFIMGSDAAERRLAYARSSAAVREAAWFDTELPRQALSLPAFCIDRVLVTQRAYVEFVRATGHRRPEISEAEYRRQGFLVHDYARAVTPYVWRSDVPPARLANHPVVLVSAGDAEAYCRWRRPGGRLPTEAEWEKASRGGDGRLFPWGDAWNTTRLNSAASGIDGTTRVDRYPAGASPYGMLDAAGNVFQWTAAALDDGRRVLKGCGWDDELTLCRPAFRHGRPPGSRHILIGFRCAGPAR